MKIKNDVDLFFYVDKKIFNKVELYFDDKILILKEVIIMLFEVLKDGIVLFYKIDFENLNKGLKGVEFEVWNSVNEVVVKLKMDEKGFLVF